MRTDKSNIKLIVYKSEKYSYKKRLGLNCSILCQENIKKTTFNITKHDLFFKIYNLGKALFNEFEDLIINISIPEYYDKKTKRIDYTEIIADEFFIELIEKINKSENAQRILLEWYNKFGIYDLNDTLIYTFEDNKIPDSYYSDCLELVNFSLIIYIIYSINKIVKSANDIPLLKMLIKVFPVLLNIYEKYGFDQENANRIMKYLLEIINKINIGIDNLFFNFAHYIKYTYDIDNELPTCLEELEDITDKNYKIELIKDITIINNPIYFAWKYLLTLLTIDNYDDGYYWCENCNEILSSNTVLCVSCKEALGKKYLSDVIKNAKLKEEIKNELNQKDYLNNLYPKGPIVYRYQQLRKNAKYNKKRNLQ